MSIPGIVGRFVPRAEWEPEGTRRDTELHRRPPLLPITSRTQRAVHYTAAIDIADGDPGETPAEAQALMAGIHLDYLRNRSGGGYRSTVTGEWFPGFPNGYSFGFDHWGNVYESAGFDYRPAATAGHNNSTLAMLMLTDRNDPGSPAMWASMRAVSREAVRRGARLPNRPWPHRKFREETGRGTATACCGPALIAQINDGLGDLDYQDAPPLPPPPIGDDEMPTAFLQETGSAAIFVQWSGFKTWIPDLPTMSTLFGLYPNVPQFTGNNGVTREILTAAGPILGPHPGAGYDEWGRKV